MLKNEKGFSLVELMIVVAIIGILAAIAIPNYQKFQEKSRQSEAKGNLAGIFTAEQSFYAQYNWYTGVLDAVGFGPSGNVSYNVGFAGVGTAVPAAVGAPAGTATCFQTCSALNTDATCQNGFNAGWNCTDLNGVHLAVPAAAVTTQATFIAGAIARLNSASTLNDTWEMTQNQMLTNNVNGL